MKMKRIGHLQRISDRTERILSLSECHDEDVNRTGTGVVLRQVAKAYGTNALYEIGYSIMIVKDTGYIAIICTALAHRIVPFAYLRHNGN